MNRNIEFVEESNPWTVLRLEDGSTIKVRLIVTRLTMTDKINSDGTPEIMLNNQIAVAYFPPDNLIDPAKLKKDA